MTFRKLAAGTAAISMTAVLLAAIPHAAFARDVAAAAAPASAPIQLLQPGDRTMSCGALATEINSLATAQAAPAATAAVPEKKKKKGGLGFLKALSAAAPMLGPIGQLGGGMGGALASTAMSAAQQGAMNSSVNDAMESSMAMANDATARALAGPSIAEQRKARLMTIFETKGC